MLEEPQAVPHEEKRKQQEVANIVSATACLLASIEFELHHLEEALVYANIAVKAGKKSYKLRRADAYAVKGRIVEAINPYDPDAEEAFRRATKELAGTHRIAARISAHVRLGRHLLLIGKDKEGERELDEARSLSTMLSPHH